LSGRTVGEIKQLREYVEIQKGRLVQVSPTRQVLLCTVEAKILLLPGSLVVRAAISTAASVQCTYCVQCMLTHIPANIFHHHINSCAPCVSALLCPVQGYRRCLLLSASPCAAGA
jgi:hypothetical protein